MRALHPVRRGIRGYVGVRVDEQRCLHCLLGRHRRGGGLARLHALRGRDVLCRQRDGIELHAMHDVPRWQRAHVSVHGNSEHRLCAVP